MTDPTLASHSQRAALLGPLADAAAIETLKHFRSQLAVTDKAGGASATRFDPVTAADRGAEAAIREGIAQAFPDDGIVGEEFGIAEGTTGVRWIIDPIDGTRAYIAGAPTWGTLIGIAEGSRAVAGLMDQPHTRERFIGEGGRSHLIHGDAAPRRLSTSRRANLSEAYLSSTAPELFDVDTGEAAGFAEISKRVLQVRYGLDCYAYCLLAIGTLDLVVEAGLNTYDIAALIPIVEGAGGLVSTWSGEPALEGGQIVASANPELHKAALEVLQPFAR